MTYSTHYKYSTYSISSISAYSTQYTIVHTVYLYIHLYHDIQHKEYTLVHTEYLNKHLYQHTTYSIL